MTFIVKVRGTPTPTTIADYECPVHGRFEAEVQRTESGDAPDNIRCLFESADDADSQCLQLAEWRISAPFCRVRLVEAVKGKWAKPERETWTDTTNIMEGQPLYEWHEDRAKVWEEKRKEDVVAFAREHHERVIGGD